MYVRWSFKSMNRKGIDKKMTWNERNVKNLLVT